MNEYQQETNSNLLDGIKFFHRVQLPDGTYTPGIVRHGADGGDWPTKRFGMPKDLSNKTVLDIGAWDGFFSFEAEKRNAKFVLATDCSIEEGGNWGGTKAFQYCKDKLKSNVEYSSLNIEYLSEQYSYKGYDVVLCYGVLYHLKSPLLAMENLSCLTSPGGICLIETAITQKNEEPMLEYRPGFDGDPTNYFYPNFKWLELAAKQNGFKDIEEIYNMGSRATYRCEK